MSTAIYRTVNANKKTASPYISDKPLCSWMRNERSKTRVIGGLHGCTGADCRSVLPKVLQMCQPNMTSKTKDNIRPSVFFCLSYYYFDLPSVDQISTDGRSK